MPPLKSSCSRFTTSKIETLETVSSSDAARDSAFFFVLAFTQKQAPSGESTFQMCEPLPAFAASSNESNRFEHIPQPQI